MEVVKELVPVEAVRSRRGKKKMAVEFKRVIVSVRVSPSTLEYLSKLPCKNNGHAVDLLVKSAQHPGGIRAVLKAEGFDDNVIAAVLDPKSSTYPGTGTAGTGNLFSS